MTFNTSTHNLKKIPFPSFTKELRLKEFNCQLELPNVLHTYPETPIYSFLKGFYVQITNNENFSINDFLETKIMFKNILNGNIYTVRYYNPLMLCDPKTKKFYTFHEDTNTYIFSFLFKDFQQTTVPLIPVINNTIMLSVDFSPQVGTKTFSTDDLTSLGINAGLYYDQYDPPTNVKEIGVENNSTIDINYDILEKNTYWSDDLSMEDIKFGTNKKAILHDRTIYDANKYYLKNNFTVLLKIPKEYHFNIDHMKINIHNISYNLDNLNNSTYEIFQSTFEKNKLEGNKFIYYIVKVYLDKGLIVGRDHIEYSIKGIYSNNYTNNVENGPWSILSIYGNSTAINTTQNNILQIKKLNNTKTNIMSLIDSSVYEKKNVNLSVDSQLNALQIKQEFEENT